MSLPTHYDLTNEEPDAQAPRYAYFGGGGREDPEYTGGVILPCFHSNCFVCDEHLLPAEEHYGNLPKPYSWDRRHAEEIRELVYEMYFSITTGNKPWRKDNPPQNHFPLLAAKLQKTLDMLDNTKIIYDTQDPDSIIID